MLPSGLSEEQLRIWNMRAGGSTYEGIIQSFRTFDQKTQQWIKLSGNQSIVRSLKRTALGLPWKQDMNPGKYPYLCQDDTEKFFSIVSRQSLILNCLSTVQAKSIAYNLNKERIRSAAELLISINCLELASQIQQMEVALPSISWLKELCKSKGISILKPEQLEAIRRIGCDKNEISNFFEQNKHLLKRDSSLILNADETQISTNRLFKVLTPKGKLPIRPGAEKWPHFSCMWCVSASGYTFTPNIILPGFKKIPADIEELSEKAYFTSTESGWMTQSAFLM
jgi:hypothetical protein